MPLPPKAPNPESENSEVAPTPKTVPGKSFLPGMNRTRAMGSSGLAAASAGWVLVGCIAFGFGVGSWLDGKFGTTYWMPILVLVGVAAGFRELFMTVAQVSKANPSQSQTSKPPVSVAPKTKPTSSSTEAPVTSTPKRLFSVPPPPVASFERGATRNEPQTSAATPSQEDVLEALLAQAENDEKARDEKSQ